MAVSQAEAQPYPVAGDTGNEPGAMVPAVPAFRFGPEAWNWLFYAALAVSFLFGFMALLNSGSVVDALLYFFISLLGTAILSISFVSFVLMPLCVKHHRRVVEAKRAAVLASRAAAIAQYEREKSERYAILLSQLENDGAQPTTAGTETPDAHSGDAMGREAAVEDQASSLRRMVAGI